MYVLFQNNFKMLLLRYIFIIKSWNSIGYATSMHVNLHVYLNANTFVYCYFFSPNV